MESPPPRYGGEAGVTHPTGMHSCFNNLAVVTFLMRLYEPNFKLCFRLICLDRQFMYSCLFLVMKKIAIYFIGSESTEFSRQGAINAAEIAEFSTTTADGAVTRGRWKRKRSPKPDQCGLLYTVKELSKE